MPSKEIFEYAIIRYLPRVEREEFLNIGVIVMCQHQKYLQMKITIDEKRILNFSEDADVEMIRKYLEAWNLVCAGGKAGGKIGELELHVRFRWLTANRSTVIQSSSVHSGICFDREKTLEHLYKRYVL